MILDLFASQVVINYFGYEQTTLEYQNISQHCMQFSAYHVYDNKTTKDHQLYDEIELVCHNKCEEDEEDPININYVQKVM